MPARRFGRGYRCKPCRRRRGEQQEETPAGGAGPGFLKRWRGNQGQEASCGGSSQDGGGLQWSGRRRGRCVFAAMPFTRRGRLETTTHPADPGGAGRRRYGGEDRSETFGGSPIGSEEQSWRFEGTSEVAGAARRVLSVLVSYACFGATTAAEEGRWLCILAGEVLIVFGA